MADGKDNDATKDATKDANRDDAPGGHDAVMANKRSGGDRRDAPRSSGRRGEPRISLKTGEPLPDRRQGDRRAGSDGGDDGA